MSRRETTVKLTDKEVDLGKAIFAYFMEQSGCKCGTYDIDLPDNVFFSFAKMILSKKWKLFHFVMRNTMCTDLGLSSRTVLVMKYHDILVSQIKISVVELPSF